MRFCPNTRVLAELANRFNCKVEEVRDNLRESLEKPSWVSRVYQDRLLDEIVMAPIEYNKYFEMKDEINEYFEYLDLLNSYLFESRGYEEIGIHHNLDRDCLTREQFSFLLDLIYNGRDLFLSISNRYNYSTKRADVEYLLGDREKRLTNKELEKRFLREKEFLLDNFSRGYEGEGLFIRLKKNNLFEFKQWGSTNNIEMFLSQIKFTGQLIYYVKEPSKENEMALLETIKSFLDLGLLGTIPIFTNQNRIQWNQLEEPTIMGSQQATTR